MLPSDLDIKIEVELIAMVLVVNHLITLTN